MAIIYLKFNFNNMWHFRIKLKCTNLPLLSSKLSPGFPSKQNQIHILSSQAAWVIYYQETVIFTNHSALQTQLWQSSAIRLLCKEVLLVCFRACWIYVHSQTRGQFKTPAWRSWVLTGESFSKIWWNTHFVVNLTREQQSAGKKCQWGQWTLMLR